MATATSQIAPESPEQAAELLRDAGGPVRIAGAGHQALTGATRGVDAAPRMLSTERSTRSSSTTTAT